MLNDNDIKIADFSKEEPCDNSEQTAIAFKLQKESGNLDKAKMLGNFLSDDVTNAFLSQDFTNQRLILVRFCITNSLTVFLQDETLAHIAIDEFDLSLSNLTGVKANDNLSGEMYSIFLIASSEKINVAEHIAKAYSSFYSDSNDQEHKAQAIKIFNFCEALVKTRIKELNFVNIKNI
jgi:hypothetical protein